MQGGLEICTAPADFYSKKRDSLDKLQRLLTLSIEKVEEMVKN